MTNIFQKSLAELKRNYLLVPSIIVVALIILVAYWEDLSILVNEAMQNEAMNHIIILPFLLSYLVYRKRDVIRGILEFEKISKPSGSFPLLNEIVGIALFIAAFLLYWYGSYTFYPLEYHLVSLPLFLAGILLILFNLKMLITLVFPIMFLLFLIPPPSAITYQAGAVLGNFNTQAVYTMLKTFGMPLSWQSTYGAQTIQINTISGTPMLFAVDLPCSGIYSLIAFTMFAAFLVYIIRGPIVKKLVLFPVGLLVLTTLNILRIALLVLIAYQFGEAMAMTIFHTISGWLLIFIGMILLLLISEKLLHLQILENRNKIASCLKCDDAEKITNSSFCSYCGRFFTNRQKQPSKKFWAKLIALLLASYLLTLSIQAPVLAFAQGLTITNTSPEMSTDVFPQVPDYQLKFLYRDQNFEKIASQDASLIYAYISQNVSNPTVYILVGVANSISNLHSWEVCLVSLQVSQGRVPLVNVLESKDIQIMENPPIIARYFAFQQTTNYTQITLYWFQKALFKMGGTIEPKYTRISLIIVTQNSGDPLEFEQKLQGMGQAIAEFWEPMKNKSIISLGIPMIQVLLGINMLFAILVQATQYAKESINKTTKLKIFEKLASTKEKLLYQTIKELCQKTKATTTKDIAQEFQKTKRISITLEELTDLLTSLRKVGIVKEDVVNFLDQPKLVWKP